MKDKQTFIQAVKFTVFSISAGLIQALAYTLLTELTPFEHWLNNIIAISLSVLWNFTLNRRFTFQATNNVALAMIKVACFYVAFIPTSSYLGQLCQDAGVNAYIIEAATMIANFVLEFLFYKFVVYRKQKSKEI